ncbi:MAG: hypothetical protein WA949_07350 [Phormidesmis sp.]
MKNRFLSTISFLLLTATATSCIPTGDGRSIPIVPVGGGGGGGGAPAYRVRSSAGDAIAPPIYRSDAEEESLKNYEQHGAVDQNACYAMAERFKREGRKVTLERVIKNHLNKGGGYLEFLCLFVGEDAETEPTVFEDYRYNSRDEYAYP